MIRLPVIAHLVFSSDGYQTVRRVPHVPPLIQQVNEVLRPADIMMQLVGTRRCEWPASNWDRVIPRPREGSARTEPAAWRELGQVAGFGPDAVNLFLLGALPQTVCQAYRELPALLLPDQSHAPELSWAVGNLLGLQAVDEARRMMARRPRDMGTGLTDAERELLRDGAIRLLTRLRGAEEFEPIQAPVFTFPVDVGPQGRLKYRFLTEMADRGLKAGDPFIVPLGLTSGRGVLMRIVSLTPYAEPGEDAARSGEPGGFLEPNLDIGGLRQMAVYEGAGLAWVPQVPAGSLAWADRVPHSPRFDEPATPAMLDAVREMVDGRWSTISPRWLMEFEALLPSTTIGPWLMMLCALFKFQRFLFGTESLAHEAEKTLVGWRDGRRPLTPEEAERQERGRLEAERQPELRRRQEMREMLGKTPGPWQERTMLVDTEVAQWVLFHPADVYVPNFTDWSELCLEFLADGRLLSVVTRSDGVYRIRFTKGPLTPIEDAHQIGHLDMRLDVRHGRLYLGEPWHMPNGEVDGVEVDGREYPSDLVDLEQWLDVPTGLYRARVTSLEGSKHEGLPAYVVQLQPVDTLDRVPAPVETPTLPPWR